MLAFEYLVLSCPGRHNHHPHFWVKKLRLGGLTRPPRVGGARGRSEPDPWPNALPETPVAGPQLWGPSGQRHPQLAHPGFNRWSSRSWRVGRAGGSASSQFLISPGHSVTRRWDPSCEISQGSEISCRRGESHCGVADSETWPHGGTAQSWEMPQWEVETPEAPHGGPGLQLGRPSGLCTAHSSAGPRLRRRAAGC